MSGTESTSRTSAFQSVKIADTHRAKLAVVYVRQSTPQQVGENRESLALQYSLVDYARALGWPAERVLVIEDDIRLGIRPHDGPNRGHLEWRPALVSTVYRILTHLF
jgi:hypothetical protein